MALASTIAATSSNTNPVQQNMSNTAKLPPIKQLSLPQSIVKGTQSAWISA